MKNNKKTNINNVAISQSPCTWFINYFLSPAGKKKHEGGGGMGERRKRFQQTMQMCPGDSSYRGAA